MSDFNFDQVAQGPATTGKGATGESPIRAPQAKSTQPINPSVAALRETFPKAVVRSELCAGDEDVVYIAPEQIVEVLTWLHCEPGQQYDHLADLTAVDHGGGSPVQVVYQLWSIPNRRALRLKCELPEADLEIDSATSIWATADWLEREVYDMFGVRFRGHPNLRRILMPDNYAEGHPLRKSFPLRGNFSRAEQTRRALSQDLEDYYGPGEVEDRLPQHATQDEG